MEMTKRARPLAAYLRENVYYTFSSFNYPATFLDLLLEVGVERIMFSADYPYESDGGGALISRPDSRHPGRPGTHRARQCRAAFYFVGRLLILALWSCRQCRIRLSRVTSVRFRRLRNVRYASNTDRIDASQRTAALCH
jgi:hypothetical protein